MQAQSIQTNGIRLAYRDEGAGEPLLIMHGLTANLHNFDGLMRHGLAARRRIIRMDLRGRGLSDKPASGYRMANHAADMLGMLDALGIEGPCDIGGHSFGALLSFYLAAHHPQRVRRVVAMDAGLEATHPDVLPKIRPSLERLGKSLPSWEVFISAIKASPYYADGFWDEDLEAYYRYDVETLPDGAVRSRVSASAIEQAVEGVISENWDQILARVTQPVLLVHAPDPMAAGQTPILSDEGAQNTLAHLPNARYFRASGHHITMAFGEHAAKVVAAIEDFLG